MDTSAALRALEESLARPSGTPCTWRDDRDAYIAEQTAELRACLIEPQEVYAVANSWAQEWVAGNDNIVRRYIALARSGDRWLLFDPVTKLFSLAYGLDTAAPLGLWGFASDDALVEWLG